MTKTQEITKALEAGAKVIVGLNTYRGASDVAKFAAKHNEETLHFAQVRIMFPGVKYRTHVLAAH